MKNTPLRAERGVVLPANIGGGDTHRRRIYASFKDSISWRLFQERLFMNDDIWGQVKKDLQLSVGQESVYNDLFLRSELLGREGDTYIIGVPSHQIRERIEGRLNGLVVRVLSGVVGKPVKVTFKVFDTSLPTANEPEDYKEEEDGVQGDGVYLEKRNAIIQPGKIEQHTQYFRRQWRPLLGPLLSELIRELRQRCYYKNGRSDFKTSFKSLGLALKVSEVTIKRALARNKDGEFKNEYLGYFIKDMETVRYRRPDGTLRNVGTRFTIYLDEPLVPADEGKLTEVSK